MSTHNDILWNLCGFLAGIAITLGLTLFFFCHEDEVRPTADNPVVQEVKSVAFETTTPHPIPDPKDTEPLPSDNIKELDGDSNDVPVLPVALPQEPVGPSPEFLKNIDLIEEQITLLTKTTPENNAPELNESLPESLRKSAESEEDKIAAEQQIQKLNEAIDHFKNRQTEYIDRQLTQTNDQLNAALNCGNDKSSDLSEKCATFIQELNKLPQFDESGLCTRRDNLITRINEISQRIERAQPVYSALLEYDKRFRDLTVGTGILNEIANEFPDSEYASDFIAVTATTNVAEAVEQWNAFVTEYGDRLAHFSVDKSTAEAILEFYHMNGHLLKILPEWKKLSERIPALTITSQRRPVQENILALLKNGYARNFWLYRPDAQHWYYLLDKPTLGKNRWLADLYGTEKTIILPNEALVAIQPAAQNTFFRELTDKATPLTDSLQVDDIGRWYTEWSSLVESIRNNKDIDPIVRMLYLKDICTILAQSDWQFQKRLASWLRVLNTKPFNGHVNWYDAESEVTTRLRDNANGLLAFLAKDPLRVVRTTQELDATVPAIATRYVCIGWLDRTFNDQWYVRGTDDPNFVPQGELFVLAPSSDPGLQRLVKIGESANGEIAVTIASDSLRRGTRVYCR